MEEPHDIIREYLVLNPPILGKPRKTIKDKIISGSTLFREYRNSGTLYFLETPQTIEVPKGYLDLWRSFDVALGERLLWFSLQGLSRLDLFIVGMERFMKYLDTSTEQTEEELEIFLVLSRLGTAEIREYLKGLEIPLGPWIYESIGKTIEL